jgi:hypothetical protein
LKKVLHGCVNLQTFYIEALYHYKRGITRND